MTTKSTKAAPAAETVDETAAAAAASAVTAQKVEYEPTTWADGSSGGTPITAAQLNRMDTGIDSLATQNNALVDDVTSLRNSLPQLLSVRRMEGSIKYSHGSHTTIHAPSIAGKSFVCWISAVSLEWVASLYILEPASPTTEVWNASTRYNDTPGSGKIRLFALYSKNM